MVSDRIGGRGGHGKLVRRDPGEGGPTWRRSPDREAMGLGRPEQSQEEEVAGDERVQEVARGGGGRARPRR